MSVPDRPLYPVEPWAIREVAFEPEFAARHETIFSLANGHLGLRGNLEEEAGNVVDGTYINGFYEESPISYGETAHGLARNHQVMLNVADGKRIGLVVDGHPLDLRTGVVELHERALDLRSGVLVRRLRWRSPGGVVLELASRRIVSLARPAIAAIDYTVTVLEGRGPLRLSSRLDARVRNLTRAGDPRVGAQVPPDSLAVIHREASGTWGAIVQRTRTTRLAVVAAMDHLVEVDGGGAASAATVAVATDRGVEVAVEVSAAAGTRVHVAKFLAYVTSRDHPEEQLVDVARAETRAARGSGFESLLDEQRSELARFWEVSDVDLRGDGALQQGVRFNLFSLFQAAGRDGRTSLAAKGLTGEGYEGHYFWDTEIFALPFFAYTQPAIARALLKFRCSTLDEARSRAAEMSQHGALYPWRTIGGEEASAYFPAGTAQYHINADLAYAVQKYMAATGDRSLLGEGGADMVFETARLWADLGDYIPAHEGAFCINEVTGPDEYTALVNNNCYTNLMARAHLRFAVSLAEGLASQDPDLYARIIARLGITEAEIAAWARAAAAMRIPRDQERGIHAQDDCFLARAVWDFAGTPADRYPLLLHFHPLVIYRHQVLKQPDVVLAQVLLSREFSLAEKKRNFDYYDPLTTGDSSLAPCIQSVAAAELRYEDLAYRYFMRTARMDLDDVNGNVADGVHIAAMAGAWVALVHGFAGFRDDGARFAFAPRIPAAWQQLRFRLRLGDALLEVDLTASTATYRLAAGEQLEIEHFGQPVVLRGSLPLTFDLRPRLAAVILDLDGVVTDTAEHHYRAWQRLAGELELPFDRELNERLKGISRLESLEIILDSAGRAASLPERVRLADRKNLYYRELIRDVGPGDLLPGIRELLAELRARGVRIAIASMSHNVWEVVRRLGIEESVDLIIDPASLAKGKPDPEIFLVAAEGLGVRTEDCVGIEDAPAGVEAIRAAGMVAVGVGQAIEGADWRVLNTAEITLDALEALVREVGRRDVPPPGPATVDRAGAPVAVAGEAAAPA
jgi:alpha,alpha-trehalose phosphorylase